MKRCVLFVLIWLCPVVGVTGAGCTVSFDSRSEGVDGGSPTCGNGVLEAGEVCDGTDLGGQSCESALGHLQGEVGCSAECHLDLSGCSTCGDGLVDGSERCDDGNSSDDDGCSHGCEPEPGWVCVGEPSECSFTCGNGRIDQGESCDDGDIENDDGCTASCEVEEGWTCDGAPSTCHPDCGDGLIRGPEGCDDGNQMEGDGCSSGCGIEQGWECSGEPSGCSPICGDGLVISGEECDDGNASGGDGCSSGCGIEQGWECSGEPSSCSPVCGDGVILSGEGCDDGNLLGGDGCSSDCHVEDYSACSGEPSVCSCVVYVDHSVGSSSVTGASWLHAYPTVKEGVGRARLLGGGCEVWVAGGVYHVYEMDESDQISIDDDVSLYGGFTGTETSRQQRDWATNETILDGSSETDPNLRVETVVRIDGGTVRIDGFTIRNSYSTSGKGGGLSAKNANLTVASCLFSNNASGDGGGISFEHVVGEIVECELSGNSAEGNGGAIYIRSGSAVVTGCLIEANTADVSGGGVSVEDGTHTISGCTFQGNSAFGEGGGGLWVTTSFNSIISGSSFYQNAAVYGGGISFQQAGGLIQNSVFADNVADNGGGANPFDHTDATFTNCVFYGNTATGGSAGGGGIYASTSSTATIFNTVVWQNTPDQTDASWGSDIIVSYSNVEGGAPGFGNIDAPPLFEDPNTRDFHLQPGSPCIDAADGDQAPGVDAEGNGRVDDPAVDDTGTGNPTYCDMGAYEHQP